MHVLVTGGTGVIGTAAIPALLRAGHKVTLLSRAAEQDAPKFPAGVQPVAADITVPAELQGVMGECDCVLHIAGVAEETPPLVTFEAVNIGGTRNLIAEAKKSGQPFFIFVSSLGAGTGQSAYHQSKRKAEELVRSYHGPWVILRPGNVYGPGDETVSMLLKMVRTLPAVPMVAKGDQPFQPLWYGDLGRVIEQVVERRDLAGRTLDIAGPQVTTTDELLRRLGEVTGRTVPHLPVPVWVTEVGVQMLEAFGATGRKLIERAGIGAPLSSAKLDMLLEGNVVSSGSENSLEEFVPEPTSLDEGLEMLADLLPEQLPGDGVGPVQASTYAAEITGTSYDAAGLLDRICARINEVMPIDFATEPGSPQQADAGKTLTAAIAGRGNIQVRLEERTTNRATFVTLEGHPLAGVMQLHTEDLEEGVRFSVHIAAQPANVVDWLTMATFGGPVQRTNWRGVVRRVVKLSGGTAPRGVQAEVRRMNSSELGDLRRFADRIVTAQKRAEHEAAV